MQLIAIYKCLCDLTRLRIVHLLSRGPLCVCHFQTVLNAPQVKVSKHLAYLRRHALVETRRNGQLIIYSLPAHPSPELDATLSCLRDCCRQHADFKSDLHRLAALKAACVSLECAPRTVVRAVAKVKTGPAKKAARQTSASRGRR